MPDYATSSGDPGRGRSPRPVVDAGEVTRKKQSQSAKETQASVARPTFQGKRFFGAKNFLEAELSVADAQVSDADAERDSDLSTLASLEPAAPSRGSTLLGDDDDDDNNHPLAAPAGWRRFWGLVDVHAYVGDPDILLSPFCKPCYDGGEAHACNMTNSYTQVWGKTSAGPWCAFCEQHDQCRFLITYRHLPKEDVSIDSLPTYKQRKLARERAAAGDQGLALPTSSEHFSPIVRPPPQPPAAPTTSTIAAADPKLALPPARSAPPSRGPTYSQVRAVYHDLKVTATRAPPPDAQPSGLGDNRPLWVADRDTSRGLLVRQRGDVPPFLFPQANPLVELDNRRAALAAMAADIAARDSRREMPVGRAFTSQVMTYNIREPEGDRGLRRPVVLPPVVMEPTMPGPPVARAPEPPRMPVGGDGRTDKRGMDTEEVRRVLLREMTKLCQLSRDQDREGGADGI